MRAHATSLGILTVTLALALGACGDPPTASPAPGDTPAPAPALLARIDCTADVAAGTMSCSTATGPGASAARSSLLTVGGQNIYVRLTSSGTSSSAGILTSTVTVENLLGTVMGTLDGHTPVPTGVEVFFATGPTNGVTVVNPTGYGTYTATNQPFFRYANQALGADSILSPHETSNGLVWQFAGNGADHFTFTVFVQTQIPAAPNPVHLDHLTAEFHACGLDGAGTAYCWGDNVDGQLGLGPLVGSPEVPGPVVMPAGVHFTAIHESNRHACALGSDGRAYCWGATQYGALGIGPTTDTRVKRPVGVVMPAGVSFAEIAAGGLPAFTLNTSGHSHSCALSTGGIAYCWGSNQYTKLGVGDTDTASFRNVPTQVVMPAGVTFSGLDAGWLHTCALGSDGKAYCWGHGGNGELGTGGKVDRAAPAAVSMPAGVTFTAIAAGATSTCALGNDLNAYCWGSNQNYKLGLGSTSVTVQLTPAKVKLPAGVVFAAIDVGMYHACGLSPTGAAYCWGEDLRGELGNGNLGAQTAPGPVIMPAGVTFTHITAGHSRTCATSAGYAYCWGETGAAVPLQQPAAVVATH